MSANPLLEGLTVGHISGAIAAAVVLLQFVVPNALAFILVQSLSTEQTAVTWSVVSRQLASSHWPLLLRSDAAASTHVSRRVAILGWIKPITLFLIAVAAIVTPLGLHEATELSKDTQDTIFAYVPDTGPIGAGTPARSDLGFSRECRMK
jgi:hypothetical protein